MHVGAHPVRVVEELTPAIEQRRVDRRKEPIMQALSIKRFNLVPLVAVLIIGVVVGTSVGVGISSLDNDGSAASPGLVITRQTDVYADIIRDTGGPMNMTTGSTSDVAPAEQTQAPAHLPGAFDY